MSPNWIFSCFSFSASLLLCFLNFFLSLLIRMKGRVTAFDGSPGGWTGTGCSIRLEMSRYLSPNAASLETKTGRVYFRISFKEGANTPWQTSRQIQGGQPHIKHREHQFPGDPGEGKSTPGPLEINPDRIFPQRFRLFLGHTKLIFVSRIRRVYFWLI